MHRLPPLGPGIRVLKTVESERLVKRYGGTVLSPSPKACSTCKGAKRFWWYDEKRQPVEYECNCRDQWVLERYLLYNGIFKNYQLLDWEDVVVKGPLVDTFVDYVTNIDYYMRTGTSLFIHGHMGLGKSMLSALLLKRALSMGYEGHFTSFIELRDGYSASWKDEEAREWFSRKVKTTGLLVIDDPGKEMRTDSLKAAEFSQSIIDDVIRTRTASVLPTIITTNYHPQQFRAAYGDAVSSLLDERSLVREAKGTDYRSKLEGRRDEEKAMRLTRPIVAN